VVATEQDVLVPIQPQGTRPPLFCVHSGDGTASGYSELAHELGSAQPVYGLQALGVNGAGQPQTRIEDMAATYLKAIQNCQAEGPYYLCGWSFGGIIAFEMAQQLRAQGEEVALLALFDTKRPEGEPHVSHTAIRKEVAESVVEGLAGNLGLSSGTSVPDNLDDRLAFIFERARAAGLIAPKASLIDLEKTIDFGAAHLWARRRYSPEPYPGRIVLLRATSGNGKAEASDYGWGALAREGVEIIEAPGTHMSLLSGQHAKIAAGRLQQFLVETNTLQQK
jgi:thioesterase domain-containing protein